MHSGPYRYANGLQKVHTIAFSVSGTGGLYPSITSRRTGGLGALSNVVNSIQEYPLVAREKVLPPFHIKLRLMKKFVKAMDKNGTAFLHSCTLFPVVSSAVFKEEGIFVGPQLREVLKDTNLMSFSL